MSSKKCIAQFAVPLNELQLRHSFHTNEKFHSFTEPDSGIDIRFKIHIHSVDLLRTQITAVEDDEKLMAIQDLTEMAKNGDSHLHSYLMDEQILLALLDLTTHWLHDAFFPIEIAGAIPQLWRVIIRSPNHQCIQYFNLSDGKDSDFFEYFVDSMTRGAATREGAHAVSSSASPSNSFGTLRTASNAAISSQIFFNRERKLQMIQLFSAFSRKSVPSAFLYALVNQVSRLVVIVSKYLCSVDSKSSTPRAAQEEFMAELLNQSIFCASNLVRAPHSLLLPTLASLLEVHETLSQIVLIRVLNVLKELPAPVSTATISNCNLLTILDTLTEHADVAIRKLANYNWSKYMMFLTSKPSALHTNSTAQKQLTQALASLELSNSAVSS